MTNDMTDDELAASTSGRCTELRVYLDQPFCTSAALLLCSFGLDGATTRTGRQLRAALSEAGFGALTARHLIRVCPLLRRLPRGRYQLRRFGT
jgi:hypothetical protein